MSGQLKTIGFLDSDLTLVGENASIIHESFMSFIRYGSSSSNTSEAYATSSPFSHNDILSTRVRLTSSDIAGSDVFGWSVASGSGRIVVGCKNDDDDGNRSGSVYVYNTISHLDAAAGTPTIEVIDSDLQGHDRELKITASDAAVEDEFGYSVGVANGRIVVGAPENDDGGTTSGSAYIYYLDGTNEVKLTASDAAANDRFGESVAIGCKKIVVGAIGDNSDQGAAYIYDLDGTNEVKLTASDGTAGDKFGCSVSIGSGRIVVGAKSVNVSTAVSEGGSTANVGQAYIFDLNGNEIAKFSNSDARANGEFGHSVAAGSGKIVIGAPGMNISGGSAKPGTAYIFDLDGNQLSRLDATTADGSYSPYLGGYSAAEDGDKFGFSVSVGSGIIVVGAPQEDHGLYSNVGAAHVFDLDGNFKERIFAYPGINNSAEMGNAVSIGSGKIVVGARYDSAPSFATGRVRIFNLPSQNYDVYVERLLGY
jgi:hypothetical protein